MALFSLSKWYLDLVTDLGEVAIVYTGIVRWGPVRLNYSSILETMGGRVSERHSLRAHQKPQLKNPTVCWNSKALGFDSVWEAIFPALRETIYDSAKGSIKWHCIAPVARVVSQKRSGLGYVEHLEMSIAPWQMPIRTLRWGRFTSSTDYVTWIDWQGDFRRRVVYMNGKTISCLNLDDNRLAGDDGTELLMDRSLVLRDGPLGATALSGVPGIRKTFPARLLQIRECKWRSRSQLLRKGMPPVEGWTIHEVVNWTP